MTELKSYCVLEEVSEMETIDWKKAAGGEEVSWWETEVNARDSLLHGKNVLKLE